MPRPSDLYAALGAPGVYQSTSWTPAILPNVYLTPPAEDSQEIYCLFYSSPATSASYSLPHENPSVTQRGPYSPIMTNVAVLDRALSFIHHQTVAGIGAPAFGRRSIWEHGHVTISPPNSGSSDTLLLGDGAAESARTTIPPRPASRRSSIFGERPPDCVVARETPPGENKAGATRKKRFHGMKFRSRAAIALRAIGKASARSGVSSEDGHNIDRCQSSLCPDNRTSLKLRKQRSLAQTFGASSAENVSGLSTDVVASPGATGHGLATMPTPRARKLVKRNSMTQMFGFARSSTLDTPQGALASPESDQAPVVRPSSPAPTLGKRKSMTQIFGLGRNLPSAPALAALIPPMDTTGDSHTAGVDGRVAALRTLEGPVISRPINDIQSTNTLLRRSVTTSSIATLQQPLEGQTSASPLHIEKASTSQSGRRSFFQVSPYILGFHRRSSIRPTSGTQSRVQNASPLTPHSPELQSPPSESTESSSSNPPSTDSEPDVEDSVQVFALGKESHSPANPCPTAARDSVVGLSLTTQLNVDGKGNIPQWVDSLEPQHADIESDEEGSSLELATRLDSLSFDQLTFDPESFASAY